MVKHKSLLASSDAASAVIVEAQWKKEEPAVGPDPCQPRATQGCFNTRVKYQAKMADIRFLKERESSDQMDRNEMSHWQGQLDKL